MIQISEHDKKVLGIVGNAPYGKELIAIVKKMRDQAASLDGLAPGGDHNAAVEGRLLFKAFSDDLIEKLSFQRRLMRPLDNDNFE